jgi:PAS domain S-box-containing protein
MAATDKTQGNPVAPSEVSHSTMLAELAEQYEPLMEHSPDGVYLWLDEVHKICNARLAALFGYSVEEWQAQVPFLDSFVAEADQERFSSNYYASVHDLTSPIRFRFRAVRADGSEFLAETDMIPITYDGHAIALHFVRSAGAEIRD